MDEVEALAKANKPKLIIAGGSAYSRFIDFKRFREIADSIGAYFMVDMAHFAGLVAGGVHPNPLEHAHVVTTTTHKTLRGPRGGMILSRDADLGKKINSAVFPGLQGGPVDACHRGEGRRVRRSAEARFQALRARRRRERQSAGRNAACAGPRHRLGRHGHASDAGRSAGPRTRQAARPRKRSIARISRPTRTPFRSTRRSPRSPPASVSARRPAPRAASVRASSARSANGSSKWSMRWRKQARRAIAAIEAAVGARVAELCRRFPIYS